MAAGPHRSPASGQKGVSSRCRKGEPLSQKCTQMFRFGLLLFLTMFLTSSVPVALAQDSCPGVVTISEDWRDVNSLTSSNQAQCDVTSGTFNTQTWYSFELGTDADLATIPTVCLKNNTCGSDIALRIHLNGHAMPAMPGDVIEAQLCGAYNDGGIYDCCRPRGRVSVKNCQYGITAYKFHDVIQDCPSAVCLLKKGETVPDDVTAETGDVCPTEPVSEAEKDTPTTPITTPSTTGEETTTPVTKPPIPSTPADTTADTAANTTADTTANTTDTASPTPDVNNKNVSGGIEDDNNVSTIATNTDLDSGLSNDSLQQNVINPTPVYNNDTDDSDNATSSTVPVVILSNLTPASDPPSFNDTPTLSTNETTTPDLQDILDQSSNDSSPAANLSTSTQFPATPVTTDSVHTSTEDGTDLENTTDSLTTLPESSSSSSSPQPLSPSLSLSSSSPSSNESLPTPTDSEPPQTTPPLPDSASTNNETTDSPPTTTDPPPTPPASTPPPVMVADVAMTTTTIPEDATETSPLPPNPDTSSTDKTPRFPDDVVMIEKVRLVFKGSDESRRFNETVYTTLGDFLREATVSEKTEDGSDWWFELASDRRPLSLDNETTYMDVEVKHSSQKEINDLFKKMQLKEYLSTHANLTLVAYCRPSRHCEKDASAQPVHDHQTAFESNAAGFITIITICCVILVVVVIVALYLRLRRQGSYIAENDDMEAKTLSDSRPPPTAHQSPFTDQQITKDEQTAGDNTSFSGSAKDGGDNREDDKVKDGGGDDNWVVPLEEIDLDDGRAKVTEDTRF